MSVARTLRKNFSKSGVAKTSLLRRHFKVVLSSLKIMTSTPKKKKIKVIPKKRNRKLHKK